MKKSLLTLSIIVALTSFTLVSCKKEETTSSDLKTEKIVVLKKRSIDRWLNFKGTMNPISSHSVTSRVDGNIKSLGFSYGDKVKKGQLLMTIDSKTLYKSFVDAMQSYLQKKSSYLMQKEDFAGTQMLYENGVIAKSVYASSQNTFESNELSFVQSNTDLKKIMNQVGVDPTVIGKLTLQNSAKYSVEFKQKFNNIQVFSPADGVALFPIPSQSSSDGSSAGKDGKLRVGTEVKEGGLLLSVGNLTGYSVSFQVNEIEVTQIHPDMLVAVTGDAFPGVSLKGKIDKVASQSAPDSSGGSLSQFGVSVMIPDVLAKDAKNILVGMTCRVKLKLVSSPLLMIPIAAISQDKTNSSIVTVVKANGEREQVKITTGDSTPDGDVVVATGVKEGDKVVVND